MEILTAKLLNTLVIRSANLISIPADLGSISSLTHLGMYLCMYVHMYVYMYVGVYVYMLCMYVYSIYVCMYVGMYVCLYICMYVYIYIVCMHIYIIDLRNNSLAELPYVDRVGLGIDR